MPSAVDIANRALRKLGATRITSFTDGSPNANTASEFYDEARDDILRGHPWNFASARVKLARASTTPAVGFDYAFQLPTGWLRTVRVFDNDDGIGPPPPYREEGDAILASVEDLWLLYVESVEDPNRMTADFREALACRLAAEMAIPLANSNTLSDLMQDRYERALRIAKSSDAIGDHPRPRPSGSWVRRRGAIRRYYEGASE